MKDVLAELFGDVPEVRLSALSSSQSEFELLRDRNRRIEVRYERLKLVTLAMWAILKDRLDLDDDELRSMIDRMDRADGQRDGKLKTPEGMADCAGCGRIVLQSSPRCPYCGKGNEDYDPLKAV
jgi:hypothetical protein